MKRSKSPRQALRFLSAHDQISDLFHLRRDHLAAGEYRAAGARAFAVWAEISGLLRRLEPRASTSLGSPARSARSQQLDGALLEMPGAMPTRRRSGAAGSTS
jgi:hypothetical protein